MFLVSWHKSDIDNICRKMGVRGRIRLYVVADMVVVRLFQKKFQVGLLIYGCMARAIGSSCCNREAAGR